MKIQPQQVAVITGAGGGIGAALAYACAKRSMRVVVADIDKASADETVVNLKALSADAIAVKVDVTDVESVAALAAVTQKTFGSCDLLCNNAGVGVHRPFTECTKADWDWVLSVNVMGVVNVLNVFVPEMLKSARAAHIVNTASITGLVAVKEVGTIYTAAKYAVIGLSEVLQQEMAEAGIGVSVLCPAAVNTRILESERNRPGYDDSDVSHRPVEEFDVSTDTKNTYTRMMEPEQVTQMTLTAVEKNQFYVITHPEWLPLIKQRASSLEAAFKCNT